MYVVTLVTVYEMAKLDPSQFIPGASIKTMRKDIEHLKTGGVLAAMTEKSASAFPVIPEPPIKPVESKPLTTTAPIAPATLPKPTPLGQEKLAELTAQFDQITRQKEQLSLQKNQAISRQNAWQTKLAPLLDRQKGAGSDNERESLKRQAWPMEQEIKMLQQKIDGLGNSWQILNRQTTAIQVEIERLGGGILTAPEMPVAPTTPIRPAQPLTPKPQPPAAKTPPPASVPTPTPIPKPVIDDQKKRFLEEIEAWASENS